MNINQRHEPPLAPVFDGCGSSKGRQVYPRLAICDIKIFKVTNCDLKELNARFTTQLQS